ncbi:S41 family peptidase [Candidatus Uhrbacteria bacterium]|nr:S41 family peptidase [Candidatus Uhrbacteria bacterium]
MATMDNFDFRPSDRPSGSSRRNILLGTLIAVLVIGSFLFGRFSDGWRGNLPDPQCEGRLVGVGEDPPITLKDVDFSDFWRVWQTVKDRHVSRPNSDLDLFYGAVGGLVGSLGDPYSVFFDPEVAKRFNDELAGTFEGIGAEIGVKHGVLTVIAPLSGTPASQAGLQPRDMILAIDGDDTSDMTVDHAVSLIRGKGGSSVSLLIGRKGWDEPKEIPIVRDVIFVQSVKSEVTVIGGKKVGVITVSSFNEDTESGFNRAVRSILLSGAETVVLDLRNNPGGFLDTAVSMAGEWVSNGVILKEQSGDGRETRDYVSDGLARLDGLRTVVLVNGGSASASEIVAGALQDHGKAVIVGDRTYGKGSVQDYTEYADGSALKLTVALWFTPLGRSIDEDGIVPDIHVENSPDDFGNDLDPQMDRALEILVSESWPPPYDPKPESGGDTP